MATATHSMSTSPTENFAALFEESLSRDLRERDERDAKRAVAPLVPAPDSQVLDSSALSIEEVVERIVGWWQESKGGRA